VFGPPKELPDEKNGSTGTDLLIDWYLLWYIPLCFSVSETNDTQHFSVT
jgi:hypothetical protein